MEHLKNLRIEKGVSQQFVADYLGITRQAYSNYENGNRAPDNETLLKLAEYFETTVDVILRGKEKAPANESERKVSDDDIKFALFGGDGEITDAMYDEVKRFAQMVKLREENEKKKE